MNDKKRLHIRRCHCCGGISEQEGEVKRCEHCGKSMAPFYFFSDVDVPAMSDIETRDVLELFRKPGQRTPIRGFTAYW